MGRYTKKEPLKVEMQHLPETPLTILKRRRSKILDERRDIPVFTAYEDFEVHDIAVAEKNLMRAILRSAMDDIKKNGEPYRDARRYLMSNDERYLFSFVSVCRHLDLCPRTIRRVLGLIERASNQIAA